MSYLFVSIFEIQSIQTRHLPAVLPKLTVIKVGTDEDNVQEMAVWSILEPLVPINQLWGKRSVQKQYYYKCQKWDFVGAVIIMTHAQ